MAPAPEAPSRRGGLNLSNPGAKEYLIVGGVALGLALVYFWWKGRNAPAAASTDTTGGGAPATPTGLSTSQFFAWIRDHQASSTRSEPEDDRKVNRDRDPKDRDIRPARADQDRQGGGDRRGSG